MSQRPNLTQLVSTEHNPFVHQQRYDALVSVIPDPDSGGWKTCQRLWLFSVDVLPGGRHKGVVVGAKAAMYKYGLPETGLRLSVPTENPLFLQPIISIVIPVQMLEVVGDGFADWYTSYNGRASGNLKDIADILEKRT
jgi:hypothetical protein